MSTLFVRGHFSVVTDHHAFCWLSSLKTLSGVSAAGFSVYSSTYEFTVTHKAGRKPNDADVLSRCPQPSSLGTSSPSFSSLALPMEAISTALQDIPRNLVSVQRADPYRPQIIEQHDGCASHLLAAHAANYVDFSSSMEEPFTARSITLPVTDWHHSSLVLDILSIFNDPTLN